LTFKFLFFQKSIATNTSYVTNITLHQPIGESILEANKEAILEGILESKWKKTLALKWCKTSNAKREETLDPNKEAKMDITLEEKLEANWEEKHEAKQGAFMFSKIGARIGTKFDATILDAKIRGTKNLTSFVMIVANSKLSSKLWTYWLGQNKPWLLVFFQSIVNSSISRVVLTNIT